MKIVQSYLKSQNILPRISFKDGKAHQIKIINAKEDEIKDTTGGLTKGIKFLVEENGENKTFFTSSVQLLSLMANVEEGETITLEMKSRKDGSGNFRSYYDIKRELITNSDIPVVEDDKFFDNIAHGDY